MQIKQLTERLSVSPQLDPADMAGVAELGFRTIINNRPDHESEGQPLSATLAEQASRQQLAYEEIFIANDVFEAGKVAAFRQLLDNADKPILAFCRSGTRCTKLWALSQSGRLEPGLIVDTAALAGYDIRAMQPLLASVENTE